MILKVGKSSPSFFGLRFSHSFQLVFSKIRHFSGKCFYVIHQIDGRDCDLNEKYELKAIKRYNKQHTELFSVIPSHQNPAAEQNPNKPLFQKFLVLFEFESLNLRRASEQIIDEWRIFRSNNIFVISRFGEGFCFIQEAPPQQTQFYCSGGSSYFCFIVAIVFYVSLIAVCRQQFFIIFRMIVMQLLEISQQNDCCFISLKRKKCLYYCFGRGGAGNSLQSMETWNNTTLPLTSGRISPTIPFRTAGKSALAAGDGECCQCWQR